MKSTLTIQFQIVWGILLILVGVGVFYRIPQVIPKLAEVEIFSSIIPFIKFCFYFIGIVLVGGGTKKLYDHIGEIKKANKEDEKLKE
jgi:hypothetical protein